jgi:hypothetical protein
MRALTGNPSDDFLSFAKRQESIKDALNQVAFAIVVVKWKVDEKERNELLVELEALFSHIHDPASGILLDWFYSVHASFLGFVPLPRSYLFTVWSSQSPPELARMAFVNLELAYWRIQLTSVLLDSAIGWC